MSSRNITIEIVRSNAAQPWHVRIRSGNGEPWFTSEQYTRKASAHKSAERLCRVFHAHVRDSLIRDRNDDIVGKVVERDERGL